jgi:hypothetical protein
MTLTGFLAARLDEDETNARRFILATTVPPDYDGLSRHGMLFLSDLMQGRVLREVEAKRKILARYAEALSWSYPPGDGDEATLETLAFAVRCLAAAYSDHPDYDPEWRP